MHFDFAGEETFIMQSFQCHLALTPVSQVRAFEFNRPISNFGLKTKHVPIIGFLIFVHWKSQLLPVMSSLSDLNGLANPVLLGLVCRWSSPGSRFCPSSTCRHFARYAL